MATIERTFTYRGRIKVSESDLQLARALRKTCTIRVGTLSVGGEVLNLTDGRDSVRVRITSVENDKVVGDLTDDHARREGFSTRDELVADLKQYYRNLDNAQKITIINFILL